MATFGDQRVPQRIWERVVEDESGCWLWQALINTNGYGAVTIDGRSWGAHRFMCTALVGDIRTGLHLDHLCRVRHCCNPAHLEPVTPAENIRRGETGKWQADKTHCPAGHEYAEENTYRTTRKTGRKAGSVERICKTCVRERQANRTVTIAIVTRIGA
jgi:hypothetical protein